jgi:hypothetical protein
MQDWGNSMHDVASVIELAVAPVFLLSAVGITLTVLTNRLARIVDRARKLEDLVKPADATDLRERQDQLRILARRARLMNWAITLSVVCAILVSCVVVALFLRASLEADLSKTISTLFIAAMLSFIAALIVFLREVFLSIYALRIGQKR